MAENDSKKESKTSKDPDILEKMYRYHGLSGKVPTDEELTERMRKAREENPSQAAGPGRDALTGPVEQ